MKSYITLRPGSSTNSTDRYLVVEFSHWLAFANGEERVLVPESSHDSATGADDAAAELNGSAVAGMTVGEEKQ